MTDTIIRIDRIHPYPAKFTVTLAAEYIEKYSEKNNLIYDPFVGSGTTLLAAAYLERYGVGTDINHIAILISKFKILDLNNEELEKIKIFQNEIENIDIAKITDSNTELYDFKTIKHWFIDDVILGLSYLKWEINKVSNNNESIETFLNLVFSSIITTVSNQDSDTRYAAVKKEQLNLDYVFTVFNRKLRTTIELYEDLKLKSKYLKGTKAYLLDSKKATEKIDEKSVDMIMTSPPYPNTYDYYLYHKHRMNWLGYDVKYSMDKEIGSRREFSSLKRPIENFNEDMIEILGESNKLLKKGGIIVLVMGDGKVQGKKYDAKTNMIEISKVIGWEFIDYSYTNLDDTSRSFQQSYRTKGKKEHVLVFKKG